MKKNYIYLQYNQKNFNNLKKTKNIKNSFDQNKDKNNVYISIINKNKINEKILKNEIFNLQRTVKTLKYSLDNIKKSIINQDNFK